MDWTLFCNICIHQRVNFHNSWCTVLVICHVLHWYTLLRKVHHLVCLIDIFHGAIVLSQLHHLQYMARFLVVLFFLGYHFRRESYLDILTSIGVWWGWIGKSNRKQTANLSKCSVGTDTYIPYCTIFLTSYMHFGLSPFYPELVKIPTYSTNI